MRSPVACMVFLVGSDEPFWVLEPADVLVARIEQAAPPAMLPVRSVLCHDEGEDPYYEERTAYVRPDQVAYVCPLGPKSREHLARVLDDHAR